MRCRTVRFRFDSGQTMNRVLSLATVLGLLLPATAMPQDMSRAMPPVVDTIVIVTRNVFGPDEAEANMAFRAANSLHVTTRTSVVRRELLFRVGEPYDSALVAETERNLRRLGVFRDVAIDTVRVGSRFAVVVQTADGWTTQLNFSAYSTGGTFSWSAGLAERNLLGTATRAGASYRDEPDRTAVTFDVGTVRTLGTPVAIEAIYDDLSDGALGTWTFGIPWRASTDRFAFGLRGGAGRERLLRYTAGNAEPTDSLQRRIFTQSAYVSRAVRATAAGYVRVGVAARVLRAEHVGYADTGSVVPDTVTGLVGLVGEMSRSRFKVVTHYNGFARDFDVDLSSRLLVTTWLAPETFGYESNGLGVDLVAQTGVSLGRGFATIAVKANALYNSNGLDSGQVWAGLTAATLPFPRNATVFHVELGIQEGVVLGSEYDIGHGLGPRAFGPHSFTGTRMIWGSLEHRAFLIDEVLGMLGIGFAAFVDYGGAWFVDEPRRLGGDVGAGLRLGATRATGPNVGRIDLAYKFGEGFEGGRWVLSFGRGFAF